MNEDGPYQQYLVLEVDGYTFQIKFESEGVILDVFNEDIAHGGSLATMGVDYDDLPVCYRGSEA